MKSSSLETINIAAITRRLDVDHKISLRFYYRIADNILRQADIFRRENNIIDLYVMLLRFSSLVSETIPCHRDYRASHQSQKIYLKKKLLITVNELEKLKPAVQQKIEELNRRESWKLNGQGPNFSNNAIEFTTAKRQILTGLGELKAVRSSAEQFGYQVPSQQFSYTKPVGDQIRRLTLSLPRPKEESLAKHSILGLNGFNGQSRPPTSDKRVRYPSEIDLTPVEIPSLHQDFGKGPPPNKNDNSSEHERSNLELVPTEKNDFPARLADDYCSLISFEAEEASVDAPETDLIRQPSPPPVLCQVQELIPEVSPNVPDVDKMDSYLPDDIACAEEALQLHISTNVMEAFMRLAESNTMQNLETCGVLAGLLKNRKFYVTALIIPKQESTSDSCETTNEEEIFEVQDKQSLFPLGWIHTHPTQSCFMSSIDVHTHYSYQIMLPEAIAIVMAPKDGSRKHGIFRLTAPGGMTVIRQCQQRGFHPHSQPPDGSPIYKTCTDIYMNPTLNFDIIDLR